MATPIPKNRALFSLDEILNLRGGTLVSSGDSPCSGIEGISTDTRSLDPGALFVAISGSQFDGHEHLGAALSAGAKAALIEKPCQPISGLTLIQVPNTVQALGDLARAHARKWKALSKANRLICITGSAGKTTTRVALAALLHSLKPGEVHTTAGNLNNLIGMPMVLFGLLPQHHIAIVEIATNAPGEIETLASIAEPDIGILTLIDAAHTQGLGSLEGVAYEKGALFRALPPHGHAIGNAESLLVPAQLQSSPAVHRYLYGFQQGTQARIKSRSLLGLTQQTLHIERSDADSARHIECTTPLLGEAGALACAAALLAAEIVTGSAISSQEASLAFQHAEVGAGAGRLVPSVLADGTLLIDDSYNANPASSAASIRAAAEIAFAEKRRLGLVLGEMRELGAESRAGHERVAQAALHSGASYAIAVSGDAAIIAEQLKTSGKEAYFCENARAASDLLLRLVQPGDVVLVKGSRSIATEHVAKALRSARTSPENSTQNHNNNAQTSRVPQEEAAP